MPDISPYGVTQNADAARVTANALVGSPLGLTTAEGIAGSAAMFSTAPYNPPKRTGCPGKNNTCRAPVMHGSDRCVFHTPREHGEPSAAP